jgi:hypothetical protein
MIVMYSEKHKLMYFENTAWGMHAMDNGTTYFARDVSYTLKMFMK